MSQMKRRAEAITVGSQVRSYDFPGMQEDCYVEGTVEEIGRFEDCDRYKIRISKVVFQGKVCAKHADYVFPPVNDTRRLFGGECDGVVKL